MKKIIILILILIFPLNINALNIDSKSAIVVNRNNNEILYEKDINTKLPIASLTKIMTTIVSLENITDLKENIIIDNNDIKGIIGYQTLGLTNGTSISYEDLLYSTMMYSAADSALALANHVFNDYNLFIEKMNEYANKLDMNNTHFSNPIGIDTDNYSTSLDLYKVLQYALKNEKFYDIYTNKKYKMTYQDKTLSNNVNNIIKQNNIKNNNIYINGYKGGYTSLSGLSFSGISKIDNNELIIITLNNMNDIASNKHIIDAINILNDIKDNYSNRIILEKNKLIDTIKYKKQNIIIDYEIRSNNIIKHFMKNNIDLSYLQIYYEGKTSIDNTIKNNDILGNIKIYYDDKLIGKEEVRYNKNNIITTKKEYKNIIIIIIVSLIGLLLFKNRKH